MLIDTASHENPAAASLRKDVDVHLQNLEDALDDRVEFTHRLLAFGEALGMSRSQLSAVSDVDCSMMSKWLDDKAPMTKAKRMHIIAAIWRCFMPEAAYVPASRTLPEVTERDGRRFAHMEVDIEMVRRLQSFMPQLSGKAQYDQREIDTRLFFALNAASCALVKP